MSSRTLQNLAPLEQMQQMQNLSSKSISEVISTLELFIDTFIDNPTSLKIVQRFLIEYGIIEMVADEEEIPVSMTTDLFYIWSTLSGMEHGSFFRRFFFKRFFF